MKKKSQRGIALLWIILAGALLLTGVGIAVSKRKTQKIKEDQQVSQPQKASQPDEVKKEAGEGGEEFVGKIEEIVAIGMPMKCTYTQGGFTGVSFIKGKRMYSEISVERSVSTYVIVKDNCMWSWYQGENQGTKMCFEDIWNMSEAMPTEAEYHCVAVSFSESQFDPPSQVNFTNVGGGPSGGEEELLKILPPKERAELENAIRETQQVLKNIEVFNFTPPSIDDITKGLDQINKQTNEQIQKNMEKQQQEFQQKYQQEIDLKKIEEHFNQNPPVAPKSSSEGQELSPAEKEYYYRKYILKDPAFQW